MARCRVRARQRRGLAGNWWVWGWVARGGRLWLASSCSAMQGGMGLRLQCGQCLMARCWAACCTQRILELGTYCGYSAIRTVSKAPKGTRLWTLDVNVRGARGRAACVRAACVPRVCAHVSSTWAAALARVRTAQLPARTLPCGRPPPQASIATATTAAAAITAAVVPLAHSPRWRTWPRAWCSTRGWGTTSRKSWGRCRVRLARWRQWGPLTSCSLTIQRTITSRCGRQGAWGVEGRLCGRALLLCQARAALYRAEPATTMGLACRFASAGLAAHHAQRPAGARGKGCRGQHLDSR